MSSGIADRVVFTGARDDVAALLAAIDVFVLSSFTDRVLPDGAARGDGLLAVPAVCTAVGGVPEMIEDGVTGLPRAAARPAALADGLVRLLGPSRTARHRRRGAPARRGGVHPRAQRRRRRSGACWRSLPRPARSAGPVRLALVLDVTFVGGVELLMLRRLPAVRPGRGASRA